MDNLQFNNENQNGKKMDKQTLIKIGVIAAVAVVALIFAIVAFNIVFGKSYKTPIKKTIKLVNSKVEDDIPYEEFASFGAYYDYAVLQAEAMDEDDDEYEKYLDELADEFGDNFKIKYKITDADKMDEDDLEDFADLLEESAERIEDNADDTLDELEDLWDDEDVSSKDQKKLKKAYEKYVKECGKLKIKEAYEVDLECEIKGSEDKEEFKLKNIIVVKINGEWIIYSGAPTPSTIYYKVLGEE